MDKNEYVLRLAQTILADMRAALTAAGHNQYPNPEESMYLAEKSVDAAKAICSEYYINEARK